MGQTLRLHAVGGLPTVIAVLDPAQNYIVHLTEAERMQFVEALAPLVNEQRTIFGDELCRYLE